MTDYTTETFHTDSAAPIDAVEKTEESARESARAGEQYYWASADIVRNLCLKLIDMTEANAKAAFELARQLVNARGPGEIVELCAAHAQKQFELFTTQAKDLVAHAQEVSDRTTPPTAHSVH
jgi:hypothetical protein